MGRLNYGAHGEKHGAGGMKTYQDYYEQAASTPVPTEVDESHTKYLAEWEAGEWPQHETGPLSITTWYACWLHAKEAGVPMCTDKVTSEG
jgi:hypothetical protein